MTTCTLRNPQSSWPQFAQRPQASQRGLPSGIFCGVLMAALKHAPLPDSDLTKTKQQISTCLKFGNLSKEPGSLNESTALRDIHSVTNRLATRKGCAGKIQTSMIPKVPSDRGYKDTRFYIEFDAEAAKQKKPKAYFPSPATSPWNLPNLLEPRGPPPTSQLAKTTLDKKGKRP